MGQAVDRFIKNAKDAMEATKYGRVSEIPFKDIVEAIAELASRIELCEAALVEHNEAVDKILQGNSEINTILTRIEKTMKGTHERKS